MTFRDGKIVYYAEISDTLHAYRVGASSLVKGDPIPRQRLVQQVSHRFVGGGV
jgi:hypothetical protein